MVRKLVGCVTVIVLAIGMPVYGDAVMPSAYPLTSIFNDWTGSAEVSGQSGTPTHHTVALATPDSSEANLLQHIAGQPVNPETSLVYSLDGIAETFLQYGTGSLLSALPQGNQSVGSVPSFGTVNGLRTPISNNPATGFGQSTGGILNESGYQYELRFALGNPNSAPELPVLQEGDTLPDAMMAPEPVPNDTIVPEPATLALVGVALIGWASTKLRHRLIRT